MNIYIGHSVFLQVKATFSCLEELFTLITEIKGAIFILAFFKSAQAKMYYNALLLPILSMNVGQFYDYLCLSIVG